MRLWLVVCAAPVQRIQQLLECVTVYRASKGISHFAKKGQLATIVEWTVNQNCCFPKQVRCQIIINFTVHIVTVFSAQISGAARVARYALGGGRGVGNGTGRWKKNHRKLFNKAAVKALFCLAPVFKCQWFFLDLKIKIKLFPRQKFKKSNCLKNCPASTSLPPLCTRPKRKR